MAEDPNHLIEGSNALVPTIIGRYQCIRTLFLMVGTLYQCNRTLYITIEASIGWLEPSSDDSNESEPSISWSRPFESVLEQSFSWLGH